MISNACTHAHTHTHPSPRNRLPNLSDDLSHWSDIFSWRQLHYKHLVKAYEGSTQVDQVGLAMAAGGARRETG